MDTISSDSTPTRDRDAAIAAFAARSKQIKASSGGFSTAPFYRKRWFVVVSALVFAPVTVLVLMTGPVYPDNGEPWDGKKRATLGVVLVALLATNMVRLYG